MLLDSSALSFNINVNFSSANVAVRYCSSFNHCLHFIFPLYGYYTLSLNEANVYQVSLC